MSCWALIILVPLPTIKSTPGNGFAVWSTWLSKDDHGHLDDHLGQNGQIMVFFLPQSSLFTFSVVNMVL